MSTDPIDPLVQLGKQLAQATAPLGFIVRQFSIVPAFDGGPHHAQVVFTIETDLLGKTADQLDVDAQFAEMTRSMKKQEEAEKIAEARERLRKEMLERDADGGGFLVDPDTEAP